MTEPRSAGFHDSATRIERLFNIGVLVIEQPDYTDSQVSSIVDRTRRCIAKKAGKPEHVVERADLQIVALAIAHAKKGDPVELIFRDRALKACLDSVLRGQRVLGVSVVDFAVLIRELEEKRR